MTTLTRPHVQSPTPVPTPRRRSLQPRAFPYLLMAPALLIVGVVSIFPIMFAVNLSLHTTKYTRVGPFIGLKNYAAILGSSAGWASIGKSMIYVVGSLAIAVPLALLVAQLLNQPVRLRRFFRVVVLMPWVISQTVAALLWKWLVNPDYGPLGLGNVAGHRVDLLVGSETAMGVLIIANVWLSYPFATILILASLQSIPAELIEAAEVDGAGAWSRYRQIVLPMLRPTLMVVAIMLTLLYFNMVTLVYTLTGGGPVGATQTMSLMAFLQSFSFFKLGLGAAYSVILFVFNIVFGLAYIKLIRSEAND